MKINLIKNTENLDSLVELINSAYRGNDGEKRWTGESHLVAGPRIDSIALQDIIESENCDLYVALLDGEVVGCICSTEYPDFIEFGLYAIKPAMHGQGLGKDLLAHIEQAHRSKNKRYRVSVVSKNSSLVEFYIKRGYARLPDRVPYPTHLKVGTPIVDQLDLTILEKNV